MRSISPQSPPRPPDSVRLRQLWEAGQRGLAIREALHGWEHLLARGGDLHWLAHALRDCGLPAEAFALQAQMARRRAAYAREWDALIRGVLHSGDPWWARALLDESQGDGAREREALRIEVELALGGQCSRLIDAWLQHHQDESAREAAVDWLVRSGRVEEAERLDALVEASPWRVRFALWRGEPRVARTLLERLSPSPETHCLDAITAVQKGRLDAAEARLRTLLDSEVRAEAWGWLATVLRKQRRYAEARAAADAATLAGTAFSLVPRLERELADACERAGAGRLRQSIALWLRPIRKLEHAPALYALGLRPRQSMRALAAVIERFGGNHTPHLTTADGGRLRPCRLPADPRHVGASLQRVLWTRGAEAARALYRELAPSVGGHPLFSIYQGELELWVGGYDEAARIFEDALRREPRTRWAWIGLGASALLSGEPRQAQRIWRKGLSVTHFAGPTLYVYRGECYRRQGDVRRARRDLQVALCQKPQRLSARINLALLEGESGTLARVERECVAAAPLLMEQLSGSPAERLEQVLEAMRGNRSSSPSLVSYHLWGRVWRGTT